MVHIIPAAKRVVVGAVAVGALSLGAAGIAGAATTGSAPTAGKAFNCANATKVLGRIQTRESDIAAGLPKLTAAQAKAAQSGNTELAARLQKKITKLESPKFKARLDRISKRIETKCQVAAPSSSSAT
jgi:hypothetical protein